MHTQFFTLRALRYSAHLCFKPFLLQCLISIKMEMKRKQTSKLLDQLVCVHCLHAYYYTVSSSFCLSFLLFQHFNRTILISSLSWVGFLLAIVFVTQSYLRTGREGGGLDFNPPPCPRYFSP